MELLGAAVMILTRDKRIVPLSRLSLKGMFSCKNYQDRSRTILISEDDEYVGENSHLPKLYISQKPRHDML